MANARERQARPIRVERVYDPPVEDLWALWTTKEGLEEWFAPEGCRVEVSALDVRAGGAFDHVMTAVGDEEIAILARLGRPPATTVRGRFVEVRPYERLHIRMTIDFVAGAEPYSCDIVVEFVSEGERVRMVITADPHPDAEMTRLAVAGLASQMRRFDSAVASRGRQVQRG